VSTPDIPSLIEDFETPTSSVNSETSLIKAVDVYVVETPEIELVKSNEQSVKFCGVEKFIVIR
jgi:hypothetical protein